MPALCASNWYRGALFRQCAGSVPAGTLEQRIADRCAGEDRLPGTPEELICRSGHPTVRWKSTTLLHAVDADEHRTDPRAQLSPPTPDAVANMLPASCLHGQMRILEDACRAEDLIANCIPSSGCCHLT